MLLAFPARSTCALSPMASRPALPLTLPKASVPSRLLSYKRPAVVTIFRINTYRMPTSVHFKRLTGRLSPLESALTKNTGGGGYILQIKYCSLSAPPTVPPVIYHGFPHLRCLHPRCLTGAPQRLCGARAKIPFTVHGPRNTLPPIFRTLFQVPYPLSPVFTALTKIAGGGRVFFPFRHSSVSTPWSGRQRSAKGRRRWQRERFSLRM
jgi:hypothetical protein